MSAPIDAELLSKGIDFWEHARDDRDRRYALILMLTAFGKPGVAYGLGFEKPFAELVSALGGLNNGITAPLLRAEKINHRPKLGDWELSGKAALAAAVDILRKQGSLDEACKIVAVRMRIKPQAVRTAYKDVKAHKYGARIDKLRQSMVDAAKGDPMTDYLSALDSPKSFKSPLFRFPKT